MTSPVRRTSRLSIVASRVARLALVTLFGLLTVPLAGAPAVAHPAVQVPDAAYFRTELTGINPVLPGLQASVDPGGEWIELANTGSDEVIVLGYLREPYLRITSTLVEENQLSQTTYLNRSLFTDAIPKPAASGGASTAAPAWQEIGTAGAARWHDHRIHWVGRVQPPIVAADPGNPHDIGTWTIHATAGGTEFEIHGTLRWVGKPGGLFGLGTVPNWLLWLVEAMVIVIGLLVAMLLRQRRQTRALSAAVPQPASTASTEHRP